MAYVYVTLALFKAMVDHSTILVRSYSSGLIHYLFPLELDHVDHANTTTFVKIKVAKVDFTASVQRIWPYQHIQQFIQLSPTWLGKLLELISAHQALNPL